MNYNGEIFRPPVEADTFLLPLTEGCSHNTCRFCIMYENIPFHTLPLEDVEGYLRKVSSTYPLYVRTVNRVYLVGADPFVLSAKKMIPYLNLIHKYLPKAATISMCATVSNILAKTDEELIALRDLGVNDLYVGVESGLDWALAYMNKGHTVSQATESLTRLISLGIHHRDMLMPGIAGKEKSKDNAIASAEFFNATKPDMILASTMIVPPNSDLQRDVDSGKFALCSDRDILEEKKLLLETMNLPNTVFWAAQPYESVHLYGRLNSDKERMIRTLSKALEKYKR